MSDRHVTLKVAQEQIENWEVNHLKIHQNLLLLN